MTTLRIKNAQPGYGVGDLVFNVSKAQETALMQGGGAVIVPGDELPGALAMSVAAAQAVQAAFDAGGLGGGDGSGGAVAPIQVTASRALTIADNGAVLYSTSASPFTLTLTSGLPAGFSFTLLQRGSGALSVAAGSATLVNATSTTGSNTFASIVQSGPDTYSGVNPLSASAYAYTGGWAGLPYTGLAVGSLAHVTDWPVTGGGSDWRWDGAYWRPMGGRVTLYMLQSDITVSAPALATESQMLSVPIPAKMIPPNGVLRWTKAADKLNTTALTGTISARMGITNSPTDGQMAALVLTTTQITGAGLYETKRTAATVMKKSGAGQANINSPMTAVGTQSRGSSANVSDMDVATNYFTLNAVAATAAGTESMVLHSFILELFA